MPLQGELVEGWAGSEAAKVPAALVGLNRGWGSREEILEGQWAPLCSQEFGGQNPQVPATFINLLSLVPVHFTLFSEEGERRLVQQKQGPQCPTFLPFTVPLAQVDLVQAHQPAFRSVDASLPTRR